MAGAKNTLCAAASASKEKNVADAKNTVCVAGPVTRRPDASPMMCAAAKAELRYSYTFDVQCKEVTELLRPGESPFGCTDIIHQLHHRNRKELLTDVMKGSVLGECDGIVQVVEFHKRGMPHLHMLIPAKGFLSNYECPVKRTKKL